MNEIEKLLKLEQHGDYSVQIGENCGEVHIHQNQTADMERLEVKIDKLQETINVVLSVIINSKDKSLIKYVNENLSQFDTFMLDSYNGVNTTHVLIPLNEIYKKPILPEVKKLLTSSKVQLSYKGVDLQRDLLTVGNVLSQLKDIDA